MTARPIVLRQQHQECDAEDCLPHRAVATLDAPGVHRCRSNIQVTSMTQREETNVFYKLKVESFTAMAAAAAAAAAQAARTGRVFGFHAMMNCPSFVRCQGCSGIRECSMRRSVSSAADGAAPGPPRSNTSTSTSTQSGGDMEDMRRARAVSVPVGLIGGGQNIHAARNNTRNVFACALVHSCVCV